MAIPTVAIASAGASLTPSPTMATLPCCWTRSRIASSFPSGSSPARTSSMPTWLGDMLRGAGLVAGEHDGVLHTQLAQPGQRLGGLFAHGISDGNHPQRLWVAPDDHRGFPLGFKLGDFFQDGRGQRNACLGKQLEVAHADHFRLAPGLDPLPGDGSGAGDLGQLGCVGWMRSLAPRTMAWARGWPDQLSTAAARATSSAGRGRFAGQRHPPARVCRG